MIKSFKQYLIENEFNYNHNIRRDWIKMTEEARAKFNIFFDLENYDPVGNIKVYRPNKDYTFAYQMQKAGGDWETPTVSFRVQMQKGYLNGLSTYGKTNGCFVYIPGPEEGNNNLVEREKGGWMPMEDSAKEYKKQNERLCVQSLKKYIDGLIAEYQNNPER